MRSLAANVLGDHDTALGYTVRASSRARRVRLQVDARDGLVVIVPTAFQRSRVPDVVRAHSVWIERALARTAERRDRLLLSGEDPLPKRVEMPGIGLAWDVDARPTNARGVRARAAGGLLVLTGAVADGDACRNAMRRAVFAAAREGLPRVLTGVEDETGWRAEQMTVRRQRSRWGSCSARHTLSLNASLAFLPGPLVRHVLVHELAHTRRLDHSPAFWALVERHDPEWRAHRAELRDAWRHVPAWADTGR